ncbi:iron-sulfur cluster assembly accessory protein [Natronospirillum operosum]|uniref:Iron-sulfur cluster assembly accessory protein n=1 Tax=Natronospirillum operosum TaxID=2759953 RepID=A0A4Z0WAN7_9GAMM|nr:iron-sulfur cluster assembly accessory protein [Natronospirillum operosum]TGG90394.1 iron-sulfur cluster assembly accessory protein [Natronospirillum operosum]
MSVESFSPTADVVRVTPAAIEHFRRQIETGDDARAVRLSVKESGCTGFMYVVDMVEQGTEGDLHYHLDEGVDLFVDSAHLAVLNGTEIDYVKAGVNRQLRFNNPNAQDYCGCGESFNIANAG